MVQPKKAPARHKMPAGQPTQKVAAQQYVFPAPTQGWVLNENLATPTPAGARVLDNWWCTPTGIRARGGSALTATVSDDGPVLSMMTYKSGATEDFFATTDAGVYDITNPAAPDVIPVPAVLGHGGYFNAQQFATAGGEYMVAVNGADAALLYDGTGWNPIAGVSINALSYDALSTNFFPDETLVGGTSGATAIILAVTPATATTGTLRLGAITGTFQNNETITSASGSATANGTASVSSTIAITGVSTSVLSHVWSFANRLFFVERGTLNAWYLPVDSIGGTASSFSLGGVFRRGGVLLFGAAWSLDSGAGLDDKCVFVSTEGEIAIYSGTNPGDAGSWALQGVYSITKPLGPKAIMQAGGDLLIATETGLVPLSEAIRRDVAALSLGAVTRKIETYWQTRARTYSDAIWEVVKWPQKNLMIVSQPNGSASCLAANLQTGAWSRITGWDTNCLGFFNGNAYFGTSAGEILRMDSGGSDNGEIYTAVWLGQHDPMGAPGLQKTVHQMRAVFQSGSSINPKLSANANFDEEISAPPGAQVNVAVAGWDISVWDVSEWDEDSGVAGVLAGDARWTSIGITGHTIAPELQLTFDSVVSPTVELVSIDATYSVGTLVA